MPYSVDSLNSIWHINGHHKLIRWKFVFADGFFPSKITIVELAQMIWLPQF